MMNLKDSDETKVAGYSRKEMMQIYAQAKEKFEVFRASWLDQLMWLMPHRAKHLLGTDVDKVKGYPIFDGTHLLAHRSHTAGFLEGNTSASRPWIRYSHPDKDKNRFKTNREWLDKATERSLSILSGSNFYHQAATFYNDFGAVETGTHIFRKVANRLHVYTLMPASYFVVNNALGEAEILIRELSLTAPMIVKHYGTRNKSGTPDWSKFSKRVKELYDANDHKTKIELIEFIARNKDFDYNKTVGGSNRQWASVTMETGKCFSTGFLGRYYTYDEELEKKFLDVVHSRRKPFVVGKAAGEEYGESGPMVNSIGLIRSLNKKAVSKDIAIEKMLDPTLQGPASIRKSYITTQARKSIPLDPTAMAQGGLRSVYEINPAIGALTMDVEDMRRQVEKFFYADFLLFLSNNPKTRTATEAQAVINEQQSVIGPNLQSLNFSYNMPISEYMLDYVITEDPYLPPPPTDLEGEWINTEFISVFAQVQRAFDLPQINQFVDRWMGIAQLNPEAWAHIDLQTLANVYEDRYFLPAGLNVDAKVIDAMKAQAQEQMQRQQMIEAIPAAAQASKNMAQAEQISASTEGPLG